MKKHDAVLKAPERDVTAVIGNGRPYAGLDQFLDDGDGFGGLAIEEFVDFSGLRLAADDRRAAHKVLPVAAENCRLEMLPLGIGFGPRDEVAAEKHAGDA